MIELLRRLENMLRKGTVAAVDHDGVLVRVKSGNLLTGWLPWFERRAGNVRSWCPPSVGEQCLVLSPGGEMTNGMVLVGLDSEANPAPSNSPTLHRTQYPDGTVIDYDHGTGALQVDAPGGSLIRLRVGPTVLSLTPEGMTLVAPDVDFQLG
jgi:phage baseplate assembly protein V